MDRGLRDLERAWRTNPDDQATLVAFNRARQRSGLEPIRTKVVHYVTADVHHRLGVDGKFNPRYGKESVRPLCNTSEVWPRTYYPMGEKGSFYASDKEQVTCKTCTRILRRPDYKEPSPRKHFSVQPPNADPFVLCGARGVPTVATQADVTCRTCAAKLSKGSLSRRSFGDNARARRRARRAAAQMSLIAR
jgi:hypothetical protein